MSSYEYERELLLDIIDEVKPVTKAEWSKVADMYNKVAEGAQKKMMLIKRYFLRVLCVAGTRKETSDSIRWHLRAKAIQKEIEEKSLAGKNALDDGACEPTPNRVHHKEGKDTHMAVDSEDYEVESIDESSDEESVLIARPPVQSDCNYPVEQVQLQNGATVVSQPERIVHQESAAQSSFSRQDQRQTQLQPQAQKRKQPHQNNDSNDSESESSIDRQPSKPAKRAKRQ